MSNEEENGVAEPVNIGGPELPRSTSNESNESNSESTDSGYTESGNIQLPSITSWYQNLNKTYAGAVLVLCFVNLINYMDRSTVAGMIDDIKTDASFDTDGKPLSDKKTGPVTNCICDMLYAICSNFWLPGRSLE